MDSNLAIREAAIRHCRQLSRRWGDAVPASALTPEFVVGDSVPEVRNGLAKCPAHHRAFDQDFLTITEKYKVVVQRERLRHQHSAATARILLDFDQRTIALPRDREVGRRWSF